MADRQRGHGARAASNLAAIDDIDILTTPAGAALLAARWGLEPTTAGPSERFDSEVFLQRSDTPLPVEVMARLPR